MLRYIPVSLMKSITEREATLENNADIEVEVTQKLSRTFIKDTQ